MKKLAVILVALMAAACHTTPPATTSANDKQDPKVKQDQGAGNGNGGGVAQNDFVPQSIYFETNNSVVAPEYRAAIQKEAEALKANKNSVVTVEGNCDERGSDEYNLALGHRRADAVKKLLVAAGAHQRQVKTASLGKEKPKATCHDESCWKENRRVDFTQG